MGNVEFGRNFLYHTEENSAAEAGRKRDPAGCKDNHTFSPEWWMHGFFVIGKMKGVLALILESMDTG